MDTPPKIPSKLDVEKYKKKLDEYLWICDEYQPGAVEGETRLADSNSLLRQTQYYQQESLRRPRDDRLGEGEKEKKERKRRITAGMIVEIKKTRKVQRA